VSEREAPYFVNHERRRRLPWSLYHRELEWRLARIIRARPGRPRVLVVGCGLDPRVAGADADYHACDLDPRAVDACRRLHPALAERIAVSPDPYRLPDQGPLAGAFDLIIAKEVVEHLEEPARWARALAARVAPGGELLLTTPNYGRLSTLALLERTVLEWIARRDGYSRRHIHPSRFDRRTLARLEVGPGMELVAVQTALTGWTLLGRWRRTA
jgi:2-polyprenyl-3-methyl-5-hydroxy-6-metoxy-1,4-benzoquinol methylase